MSGGRVATWRVHGPGRLLLECGKLRGGAHWVGRTGRPPGHHREDARENGTLLLRTSFFLGALPHFAFFLVWVIGLKDWPLW